MASQIDAYVSRPLSWPLRRLQRHVATENANKQLHSKMHTILQRLDAIEAKLAVPTGLQLVDTDVLSNKVINGIDRLDEKLELVIGGLALAMDCDICGLSGRGARGESSSSSSFETSVPRAKTHPPSPTAVGRFHDTDEKPDKEISPEKITRKRETALIHQCLEFDISSGGW